VIRAAAAVLVLLLQVAAVSAAEAPQWRTVATPNFTVVGDAGDHALQNVAARLEQFRAVLGRVLPGVKLSTPAPTVLVVFGSKAAYESFQPRFDGKAVQAAGFFQAGPDVNYIVLTLEGGGDGLRIAFHEYSHLVLHNWMAAAPVWLDEGLAEYYSSFAIADDGKTARIGAALPHHVQLLHQRFLPLIDVLALDRRSPLYNEGDQRTVFYAESWVLMHYLLMETPHGDVKINSYLAAIGRGEPAAQAFEQAFQMAPAVMEQRLRDYVNEAALRSVDYDFKKKVDAGPKTGRALAAAEIDGWLGDVLLRQRRFDEAGARLERAVQLDPRVARAQLSLGVLRLSQRRPDEAWVHLQRAIALDPENFFTQYAYAIALLSFRPGETPVSMAVNPIAAARAALTKAVALSTAAADGSSNNERARALLATLPK
jgi:tetratricopeptide (TPR) repeat protein